MDIFDFVFKKMVLLITIVEGQISFSNTLILSSLRKELKVRTPFNAVQSWFQVKPEIFKILPDVFERYCF